MGKGRAFTFTLFATLGALVGYASYMAKENEFSKETIDKYDTFLNKAKNVGTDIQRTYTTIGDKKQFTQSTKNLGASAQKLASKTGDLVVSATSDMYKNAKERIANAINNVDFDNFSSKVQAPKKKVAVKATTKKKVQKKAGKAKKK